MSGARFLLVAALVAVYSLPWMSTVAHAEPLQVDEKAGQAIESHRAQAPPSGPDTGGETPATATDIPSPPYWDSGNTCGHTQDYVASCGANSAPDLFYRYIPVANMVLTISTCGSGYDTVLYVLENGVEIACNDDFCGLQSQLGVTFVAGRVYIIGVSGFSTACGPYILNLDACRNCVGACCLPSGCVITNPWDCQAGGGVYLGGPTCEPDPCAATPAEAMTWGRIKSVYRGAGE